MNLNLKALIAPFAFLLAGSLFAVDFETDLALHQECADQCDRCAATCTNPDCIKACQGCAATCRFTMIMMTMDSPLLEQVHAMCDLACKTCIEQCSKCEEAECKRCIETCNACLAACPKHQAEMAALADAEHN